MARIFIKPVSGYSFPQNTTQTSLPSSRLQPQPHAVHCTQNTASRPAGLELPRSRQSKRHGSHRSAAARRQTMNIPSGQAADCPASNHTQHSVAGHWVVATTSKNSRTKHRFYSRFQADGDDKVAGSPHRPARTMSMTHLTTTLLIVGLLVTSGCAICASPGDDEYAAYGGRWQRTDRNNGRVGSVLDPAGVQPDSSPPIQPTPAIPNDDTP